MKTQAGITLVEIMLGFGLAIIVIAGLVALAIRAWPEPAPPQAPGNGRRAMDLLADDVRNTRRGDCTQVDLPAVAEGREPGRSLCLLGYDNLQGGFPGEINAVRSQGADAIAFLAAAAGRVLPVRAHHPQTATVQVQGGTAFGSHGWVLMGDRRRSAVLRLVGTADSGPGYATLRYARDPADISQPPYAYGPDARLLPLTVRVYFVGEKGLYRQTLGQATASEPVVVAAGVQDLQILYGADGDGDAMADVYSAAGSVGGGGMRILSVRLLMHMDKAILGWPNPPLPRVMSATVLVGEGLFSTTATESSPIPPDRPRK